MYMYMYMYMHMYISNLSLSRALSLSLYGTTRWHRYDMSFKTCCNLENFRVNPVIHGCVCVWVCVYSQSL